MLTTARKFVLVPASQWIALQQETAPEANFDLLGNTDRERVQLYNQALQRHLIQKRKPIPPVPITIAKEPTIKEPTVEKNINLEIDEPLIPEHVIEPELEAPPKKRKRIFYDIDLFIQESRIPKKYRGDIKELLLADIIDFNHNGELLFQNKTIPKSNSAKLLLSLITKNKTFKERSKKFPGYKAFQTELKNAPLLKAKRRNPEFKKIHWDTLY
jgi:hypothetical protein